MLVGGRRDGGKWGDDGRGGLVRGGDGGKVVMGGGW